MSVRLMTSPTAGSRIAPHLTLRSVLGSGGTATVFEAFHARLQAPVAVKVSMVDGAHGSEADERLVREARICARLVESCFPRVYDIARLEDGRPYYVMEKVVGQTLDVYAAQHAPDLAASLGLVKQLLWALRVAHDHGIVHRDVKPENVILETTADGSQRLRLMDFGIALLEGQHDGDPDATPRPEVLGTPGYMAPEQACGAGADARADIHAVGIVLYELVAGRLPFDATEPLELARLTLRERVPDVRLHAPGCPPDVAGWIARATAHDPKGRYQSARQALDALCALLRPYPAPVETPEPIEAAESLRTPPYGRTPMGHDAGLERITWHSGQRRHRSVLVLAAVAALAMLAWALPGALESSDAPQGEAAVAQPSDARTPGTAPVQPIVEAIIEVPDAPLQDGDVSRAGTAGRVGRASHERASGRRRAASPGQADDAPAVAPLAARAGKARELERRREQSRRHRRARSPRPRAGDAVERHSPAAPREARPRSRGKEPRMDPELGIPENPY